MVVVVAGGGGGKGKDLKGNCSFSWGGGRGREIVPADPRGVTAKGSLGGSTFPKIYMSNFLCIQRIGEELPSLLRDSTAA